MPSFARAAVAALALAAALAAGATSAQASYDDRDYWAFADRMQQRLDPLWDESAGYYRAGPGGVEPMTNSLLLLSHSVAAAQGHEGPARNDRRARVLAARLVDGLPYVSRKPATAKAGSQVHAPGWVSSMTSESAPQHLVFDAEVVDGLAYAYRARHALGLPDRTAARIRDAIHRTAHSAFWRWPAIRLNQVNWYALMYAADATVTGDGRMLRRDMALQLRRFFAGAQRSDGRAGNFGAGMRFYYLPYSSPRQSRNVDSAEYANIVLSFTRFYGQARRAGMPPLEGEARRLMREWSRRAIAGYWTHAGYMNWDSGLGFERWHQAKKLGLTQQALIGLASSPSLLPGPRWAGWAKDILDRGLGWYDGLAERAGGIPEPVFFGLKKVPQGVGSARLAAARMQANAARAIDAGLGRAASARPPALYAFDPDIGRLAVTTPAYNTAVVPVNQRAFPYGGLELARLFDGRQEVAGTVGGTGAAGFGLVVRDGAGRRVLATQDGRDTERRTFTLTRAPRGVAARAASRGHAYAGPFRDLRATGRVRGRGFDATVRHRFTQRAIETRWLLRRTGATGPLSAEVSFPSAGGRAASVTAIDRDGARHPVSTGMRLDRIRWLEVQSAAAAYRIDRFRAPAGATARLVRPAPQASNPAPGPSLTIRVADGKGWAKASLAARIVPARAIVSS